MAKKTGATELKRALTSETEAHAKTKTALDSAQRSATYANERAAKAERELAEVHAFLNAVPNPPAEKIGEYGGTQLSVIARLSVYLATR